MASEDIGRLVSATNGNAGVPAGVPTGSANP
jgi:hypothetical protein